jgi:CheY-like chemotaxis protein
MSLTGPILLIDDDEEDHFILQDVLRSLNVKNYLHTFMRSQDAIDYLRSSNVSPFLILCDINMPRIGGLDLRHIINQDKALAEKCIPFIFLSTAASEEDVRRAYQLTVQGFFIKNFTFQELRETISLIIKYWTVCCHPTR